MTVRPSVFAGQCEKDRRTTSSGFIERFIECVRHNPDTIAVERFDGSRVTYGELLALAERLRAVLLAGGIGAGDAVLVALPTGAELFAAFFASSSLGAVCVPIDPRLTDFELEPIFGDARPVAVVADVASEALSRRIRAATTVRLLIATGMGATWTSPSHLEVRGSFVSLDRLPAERSPLVPPRPDTTVSCHFTYRGFGYPIGALHTYGHYSWVLSDVLRAYSGAARSLHLAALPLHSVYGLVGGALLPLCSGSTILMADGRLGALLVERSIRFCCLVPLQIKMLAAEARQQQWASGLHPELEVISGGSLLPECDAVEFERAIGRSLFQGYGLTEALPVTANHSAASRAGSLGKPLCPETRIEVIGADGHPLPPGGVGEIVITGPSVMQGYLCRPLESGQLLRQNRLWTGDLGCLDRDGFLFFRGRRHPICKTAGKMVDLTEVQRVLELHPAVVRAHTSVVNDFRIGERVCASIVLSPGSSATAMELVAFCRERLSSHKLPRRISFEPLVGEDGQ